MILRLLLLMLSAIEFDNQLAFGADEIGDVRPDRVLAAKLVAAQLTIPEVTPEQAFGIG